MTMLDYWLQAAGWIILMMIAGGVAGAAVTRNRDRS